MEGYRPKTKIGTWQRYNCLFHRFGLLFLPFLLLCILVIAVTHSMGLCIGTGIVCGMLLALIISKNPKLKSWVLCDRFVETVDKGVGMWEEMKKQM